MEFIATIVSVIVVSLISFIGIFFISMKEERLHSILFILISFAVGSLLGDVFFHILPELFSDPSSVKTYGALVLSGILLFFVFEHFLHWRHTCHHHDCENHVHPVAHMNLFADAIHNFFDGVMIGTTYFISFPLGIATTIAIMLHEIPQELGRFGVLVHAGLPRKKALFFNFLSGSWAIIGGVIAFALGSSLESFTGIVMSLTAGGFLYIAGTDLIPELHKNISTKKSFLQLCAMCFGVVVMYLFTFLE